MSDSTLLRWWRGRDRPAWRNFAVAMVTLAAALVLALYSAALAEMGRPWLAGGAALLSLSLAAWVAVAIVPAMARRTSLRWLLYQVDYRLTREGVIYLAAIFVLVLAAINTGNNLLFVVLSCLLAGILISGILSRVVLTGLELNIEVPEHVFAQQPVISTIELRNEKQLWPSYSLRVVGLAGKTAQDILPRPVYFPYIPRRRAARQKVELLFPRRGVYRQDAFGIRTKFPFGFLEKTRRVESSIELVVYPHVEPTAEFYEILPLLSGEMESFYRGRGHDLYSIRDYQPSDSARFVDWKASAKTGALKVREFTREDERRLMLILDPAASPAAEPEAQPDARARERFERAVSLAACIAWHFYEIDAVMQFLTDRMKTPVASASEIIYDILRELALVEPNPNPSSRLIDSLARDPEIFKIILTSRPRGTIPTSLWTSSFIIFLDTL